MSNDEKTNQGKDFEGLGQLLDHDYDGIQELDNPLPGWWLVTFWGAIVFAFFYFAFYQLGGGPSLDDELKRDMAAIQAQFESSTKDRQGIDWEKLKSDGTVVAAGKAQFEAKCSACHGVKGEGLIGPNLTDAYWIHGGTGEAIHKVIMKGVLEKGMPAWEAQMKAEETDAVTVYVMTLIGTNPPNAKPPQGEKAL
jgi:cytochrome c oxidase cbb3-type subunit 3